MLPLGFLSSTSPLFISGCSERETVLTRLPLRLFSLAFALPKSLSSQTQLHCWLEGFRVLCSFPWFTLAPVEGNSPGPPSVCLWSRGVFWVAGGSGMTHPLHATVVQPGYPAHRRIVEAFGTEVLLENGDIDRKVLGDLIFNQPDRRQLLNSITHPEIRKEMMKETFKYFLRGETLNLGAEGDRYLFAKPFSI